MPITARIVGAEECPAVLKVSPTGPCTSIVYTWALKGVLYHCLLWGACMYYADTWTLWVLSHHIAHEGEDRTGIGVCSLPAVCFCGDSEGPSPQIRSTRPKPYNNNNNNSNNNNIILIIIIAITIAITITIIIITTIVIPYIENQSPEYIGTWTLKLILHRARRAFSRSDAERQGRLPIPAPRGTTGSMQSRRPPSNGCTRSKFPEIGGPFRGCPSIKGPTIWGPYWGP